MSLKIEKKYSGPERCEKNILALKIFLWPDLKMIAPNDIKWSAPK